MKIKRELILYVFLYIFECLVYWKLSRADRASTNRNEGNSVSANSQTSFVWSYVGQTFKDVHCTSNKPSLKKVTNLTC